MPIAQLMPLPVHWPYLPAIERLSLALALGLFVGLERQWRRKEAGLRNNIGPVPFSRSSRFPARFPASNQIVFLVGCSGLEGRVHPSEDLQRSFVDLRRCCGLLVRQRHGPRCKERIRT